MTSQPSSFHDLVSILLRRWWLVLIVPAIAFPLLVFRAVSMPYQSTVRAVVLIPGDTEIPGNSERPELMVLDDLPGLVRSRVFAEAVAAEATASGSTLSVEVIQSALGSSRYSRILTITTTSDDSDTALAVANAAAGALPEAVNRYLVAPQGVPATVEVIDPASAPTRSRPNQWFIVVLLTLVATGAGCAVAIAADSWGRSRDL